MPGSVFSYSNTSFALLELLIEEVTGRDFAEYMEAEVLVPLGMNHSSFTWREEFRTSVATGYDLKGRPVPAYIYPYEASGGLFAPVGDLAQFVSSGMIRPNGSAGRKVLKLASAKQLYAPTVKIPGMFGVVSDAYGLGHFVETLPSGHQAVWHGGQGNGWMTHFHSVPETGDGIVILTNSQRSWPFFSSVLRDWAKWSGYSSVGMGNIVRAETGLQILIGLLLSTSLWQALRLRRGVASGTRRFAPFAPEDRLLRLGQIGLFAVLASVLIWSVSQDYLFINSFFPILSNWLGGSLLSVASVSLASACLPTEHAT
jgi:CubicO group peptidase (beta-lactamase class C family)